MVKLTANDRFWLEDLSKAKSPCPWTHRRKAIGNKFVKHGLAEYRLGYPVWFVITPAGRAALADGGRDAG